MQKSNHTPLAAVATVIEHAIFYTSIGTVLHVLARICAVQAQRARQHGRRDETLAEMWEANAKHCRTAAQKVHNTPPRVGTNWRIRVTTDTLQAIARKYLLGEVSITATTTKN
jgi:hypothetical protein